MIRRGDIRWVDLGRPSGSEPGFRRPVVVVSADAYNMSRIATVVAVAITSNLGLAAARGNVTLPRERSGLDVDSVANVSQIVTVDKRALDRRNSALAPTDLAAVDDGLRLVLDL